MAYQFDLNNPNVKRLQNTVRDTLWEYARTHTAEEIAELNRKVEAGRQLRARMFGEPQPVIAQDKAS